MAIHHLQKGQISRPAKKAYNTVRLPAPLQGIDAPLAMGTELNYCAYTINLIPNEYGMQTRYGFREHVINLDTGVDASLGVRTMIPFDGVASGGADD